MVISYCTTCHSRLWQLQLTLDNNLAYTIAGDVELCILVYNDLETFQYLEEHYQTFINDGRLVIKHRLDDVPFTCGRVKNFAHELGLGKVLFNLDADNFIDIGTHEALLRLRENEVLHHVGGNDIGLAGRIGVYRTRYDHVDGYRDVGRNDDGDFIRRLLWESGMRMKLVPHRSTRNSVSNQK